MEHLSDTTDKCHVCNGVILVGSNKAVRITYFKCEKHSPTKDLWFHAGCFFEVAGEDYAGAFGGHRCAQCINSDLWAYDNYKVEDAWR